MSRTPRRRSKSATLFETADWLDPISLLAALKEPASTVRTNATRPVVFSRIEVIEDPRGIQCRSILPRARDQPRQPTHGVNLLLCLTGFALELRAAVDVNGLTSDPAGFV